MQRGDLWWAALGPPIGKRPVVIITRSSAVQVRTVVTIVELTSTIRGIPVEVPLGPEDHLPKQCVANCDAILTVPKVSLTERITHLSPEKTEALDRALKHALALK